MSFKEPTSTTGPKLNLQKKNKNKKNLKITIDKHFSVSKSPNAKDSASKMQDEFQPGVMDGMRKERERKVLERMGEGGYQGAGAKGERKG